jgi:hypothetical protein
MCCFYCFGVQLASDPYDEGLQTPTNVRDTYFITARVIAADG